eukprot:7076362-Pyramimonas_sp.AAC.1
MAMAGWPRHDLKWNILAHGGRADKSGPTMYDTCMTFSPGAAQVLPPPLDLQQDVAMHGGSPMARIGSAGQRLKWRPEAVAAPWPPPPVKAFVART